MPIIVNGTELLVPEVELIPDVVTGPGITIPQGFKTTFADVMIGPLPLYVIIEAFCFLVLVGAFMYYVLRVRAMSDVKNYNADGRNIITGNPILGWRLSNDLRLSISALQYSAGAIAFGTDAPNNKSIWLHPRGGTVLIGGKPSAILSEGYAVSRSLQVESALMQAINYYNSQQKDLKLQIHSFVDWQNHGRRILMSLAPQGLCVDSYRQLNPRDIEKFVPKGLSSAFLGSVIWHDAQEMMLAQPSDEGFWGKYLPIMACAGFAMIALCGAFFFPLG